MDAITNRARFDWLAEIAGAAAVGGAAGFAALKLAPSFGLAPGVSASGSGLAAFALGLCAMRMVRPGQRRYALADFEIGSIEADELMLETLAFAPDDQRSELLLDDPLVADPASRVVQLFARPTPSAGELKERIDRHLADGRRCAQQGIEAPLPDASAALYSALEDLRRSLR